MGFHYGFFNTLLIGTFKTIPFNGVFCLPMDYTLKGIKIGNEILLYPKGYYHTPLTIWYTGFLTITHTIKFLTFTIGLLYLGTIRMSIQ